MSDLRSFLTNRGVDNDVIDAMEQEKIDVTVIPCMEDSVLSTYLPLLGDRIAVRQFCREQNRLSSRQPSGSGSSRKFLLLQQLRQKLKKRENEEDLSSGEERSGSSVSKRPKNIGNKNASKSSRIVSVGWRNVINNSGHQTQVRTSSGGGSRNIRVAITAKKADVIAEAKKLFFPSGESPLGHESEFSFDLLDARRRVVPDDQTVGDMYATLKLAGYLRFNMATRRHEPDSPASMSNETVSHDEEPPDVTQKDDISVYQHSGDSDSDVDRAAQQQTAVHEFRGVSSALSVQPFGGTDAVGSSSHFVMGTPTGEVVLRQRPGRPLFVNHQQLHGVSGNSTDRNVTELSSETTCQSLPVIDVDADEQADIDAAIQRSLHDRAATVDIDMRMSDGSADAGSDLDLHLGVSSEKSLTDILQELQLQIDINGNKNVVNVDRADILDGAFRAFARKTFNPCRLLTVRFAGEDGIDSGGLTREFLRLAVRAVQQLPIFSGGDRTKNLTLDYIALENNKYKLAGQVLAYSIVHRGTFPTFFSELLYSAISGSDGCSAANPQLADVGDEAVRQQLHAILKAEDDDQYRHAAHDLLDAIDIAGCMPLAQHVKDKQSLVNCLCRFIVLDRVSVAFEQFKGGLRLLNVLHAVQQNPVVMQAVFVDQRQPLDAATVESLFELPNWSESGSNRRRVEARIVTYWRDLLQDLEESSHLEDLMIFATGLDAVPAIGFDPQPSITFGHDVTDCTAQFPLANTCTNSLRLPIVPSYDVFSANMLAAITTVVTFTTN